MQLSDALRTILAAAINSDIGATAFARFLDAGVSSTIATCNCNNPCFSAGAAGVTSLDVTPAVDDAAPAAGTVGRIGFYQDSTTAIGNWRFLLGVATGGAPDVTMSNNVVATTDTVQIASLSITVPAGAVDTT